MWAKYFSGPQSLENIDVSKTTMGNFMRFLRHKIISFYYEISTIAIGGLNTIVEIDKTLVSCNCGRLVKKILGLLR